MDNGWTLHVENFGPIESADVTLSPLTFFVGDNNSGKSYLMALIYGLMCGNDVLSDLCEDSEEYKACAAWVESLLNQREDREKPVPFNHSVCALFENLWNKILMERKDAVLMSIFQDSVSAKKISVSFPKELNWMLSSPNPYSYTIQTPKGTYTTNFMFSGDKLLHFIIRSILRFMAANDEPPHVSFIPTSRTGFMLTYKPLTRDALEVRFSKHRGQSTDSFLTLPCTDFLGTIATLDERKEDGWYQSVVELIEKEILHGKILISNKLPVPSYFYLKNGREYPLHIVSDVVRDTAPLVLMLKYQYTGILFIEEPELSLHPALQLQMARVLVKLANAGLPVIAATHSDTILQHVNNMVKLSRLSEERQKTLMDRYSFDANDAIPAEKVSMYQFDVQKDKENKRTLVRRLSCGDYGFRIPTFYDPLETLLNQSRDTEPDAEEYEDE